MNFHYRDPKREHDPHALADVEVFEAAVLVCSECGSLLPDLDLAGRASCPGCDGDAARTPEEPPRDAWWWWSCMPGCMPEGDPSGPFDSEDEALADAREGVGDYESEDDE